MNVKVLVAVLGAATLVGGGAAYVATSGHGSTTRDAAPAVTASSSAPAPRAPALDLMPAPAPPPSSAVAAPAPPTKAKTTRAPASTGSTRTTRKAAPTKSAGELSTPGPVNPPADTQPPTQPSGLTTHPGDRVICLSWQDSTDNVGVAGYRIYRDGTEIPLEHGSGACGDGYQDTVGSIGCQHTYTYRVVAYDAAGNVSTPAEASGGPAWCPI